MDSINFFAAFGDVVWTLVSFVLALSIIVTVHEYGHYIVGRWSGIHADVFSLGFGPVLYSRVDKRGTRWQLAALPFGGFVKFAGDADAASGKDGARMSALSDAERRRTMHGAPLWARTATVAAGPIFNFILSIVVFMGLFLAYGVPAKLPVIGSVKPLPFEGQSLLPGDQIKSVADVPTPDFAAFQTAIEDLPSSKTVEYVVQRGDQTVAVAGPYPMPPIIDGVMARWAADKAGILPADVIVAVNDKPVFAFEEMRKVIVASNGKPVQLDVWRAGKILKFTMTPQQRAVPKDGGGFENRWLLGMTGGLLFVLDTRTPGFVEAFSLGLKNTWKVIGNNFSFLRSIAIGEVSTCNLSGPIGIAKASGDAARLGLERFLQIVALLSTSVGLMNLFPIPVLDGGHLVFFAYEAVTGKPPTDRALRLLMGFGLAVLLGLMIFASTNDLFCP